MKFLIDASSDARLVDHLRRLGHDVTRIGTDYPASLDDQNELALSFGESRILITDDRHFGELVTVRRQPHRGVIYFRLVPSQLSERVSRLDVLLESHADRLDRFLVVGRKSVRVLAE